MLPDPLACRVVPRGAPLLGFRALQRITDSRVHSSRGFRLPRYVPSSGFRPSRRFAPREPSRPSFRPERSWASPFRGLLLRVRRCLSRGPSPPRRWRPARCAPRRGQGRARTGARPVSPSSGLLVPGVRSRRPAVRRCRRDRSPPGLHPPWGSSASRRAAPIWRPSPPGLPDGLRTCALRPPRPSGVFDDERPSSTPGVEQPLRGFFPTCERAVLSADAPATSAATPKRPPERRPMPSMVRPLVREQVLSGTPPSDTPPPDLSTFSNPDPSVNRPFPMDHARAQPIGITKPVGRTAATEPAAPGPGIWIPAGRPRWHRIRRAHGVRKQPPSRRARRRPAECDGIVVCGATSRSDPSPSCSEKRMLREDHHHVFGAPVDDPDRRVPRPVAVCAGMVRGCRGDALTRNFPLSGSGRGGERVQVEFRKTACRLPPRSDGPRMARPESGEGARRCWSGSSGCGSTGRTCGRR